MKNQRPMDELLQECEREPIHIPGFVQPHGIMLTLRSSDLAILQISESVFDLVGIHPSELLHQPLSRLMPVASVDRALKRLGDRTPRLLNPIPIELMVRGKVIRFDGILHRSGRVLILELEKHVSEDRGYGGFGGFYEAIREVTSQIMVSNNLDEILEIACQEMRKLTGFDRVLAYKFDPDWNGEVINESKVEHVPSLMHHHFPASDIPKQARDLYTSNWLRLIPNANYVPSPMMPTINPITDRPLDMSNAVLRSVSPVHLEYMRNMGQIASMSVSLLKGRNLWGLISCHHSKPLYLKYDVRVAAEFIGQMVSAQIYAREDNADTEHKLQLKKLYDDLLRVGGGYSSIPHSFSVNSTSLLGLVNAQGAAIVFDNKVVCVGTTPAAAEVKELYAWLNKKNEPLLSTQSLVKIPGTETAVSSVATGLLAIKIPHGPGDVIMWFRPEVRTQQKWAGDPDASKHFQDGKIHPRKSFETWFQNSEGLAQNWLPIELDAADELRTALVSMAAAHAPTADAANASTIFRSSLQSSIVTSNAAKADTAAASSDKTSSTSLFAEAALDSRLLLEGFSEFAVLFLDLKGNVQNWSSGARRLLGYESKDVLGRSLSLLFSEEDTLTKKLEKILERVSKRNRSEEEMWLYRAGKSSFWAKVLVAEVREKSGGPMGFSVIVEDVTREKSAEEELKAMKLSAEAANRSKSAFLANISHEIRTPLGAVLGFSELMSAHDLADRDRDELYGKVRRNGEQLTVLINDLLDISKVESGKIEIESLSIDLQLLLNDVEQLFSTKATDRKVKLSANIIGSVPRFIMTDPTRLRQILINLLSNAIKFTPENGEVRLEVSLASTPTGPRLLLKVIDTGRGITEDEMSRLFQPFVQADVSTTRQYGGTGLGLFLSQRLARALGGDVSIEWSKPGKGTCFTCSIEPGDTTRSESFTDLQSAQRHGDTSHQPTNYLDGIRVLVVDDSIDNRELIKNYLEKVKASVTLAENGQLGVEKAVAGDFDVVLMDVQMPVLDGNQAMRVLVEKGFRTPVIALTAHAMREERENSLAAGFTDYLTKPIDRRLLISRIGELSRSQ